VLPPEISAWGAAGLVALSYLTSTLTATLGVGGGIALISVMASFLSPATVLPVHGVVQLGSNTGRTVLMRAHIDYRIVVLFSIGALVGVGVAAMIFVSLSTRTLQLLLGLFILVMVWAPRFKVADIPAPAFLAVGAVATFCTMFVGATGPLVATFMSPERLGRRGVVATSAACLSVQHALKVVVFGAIGFAFLAWLPLLAAMIASGFLGTLSGRHLLERTPEHAFALIYRAAITALAVRLLWSAL